MSQDVDVLKFDWNRLVKDLVEEGYDNQAVVEDVLKAFGEKICDQYVILVDEHRYEDELQHLCNTLEYLFCKTDCFGTIYDLAFDYICGHQSGREVDDTWLSQMVEHVELGRRLNAEMEI